ncbi:MAG: fibronectin type III domain-containing protein, partial [Planctomycetes bacterium]|nr:fibronectin type III domain-containing protein [Planctomycetota bacterium]
CLAWAALAWGDNQPQAVPTFHCVGLYWSPADGSAENTCRVRYRPAGTDSWREALPLWFDERQSADVPPERRRQYRGSIVNLRPGTAYEVELSLLQTGRSASVSVRTWSEEFPVAQTVPVRDGATPLLVNQSGSPDGYVLYAPAPNRKNAVTTLDVAGQQAQCIEVRASYVILRGLTLKNAQQHGIRIFENCHDVVIEGCDISGWGRSADDGWGLDYDAAIYCRDQALKRVIVQRNYLHHPRSNSNNWRQLRTPPGRPASRHPEGPQTVVFWDSEGNHVLRYNTVDSDDNHYYNDVFGAGANSSTRGFPNRDSDIYGNLLSHCWDDAIESEGANCNVRIWGNYTTHCLVGIACASTSLGPLYVWRNISGTMQIAPKEWDGGFLKTGGTLVGGRIFVFHNTLLQPARTPGGGGGPAGARTGLGWGGAIVNVTSRNNLLHVASAALWDLKPDPLGDYDYDLHSGTRPIPAGQELHGIKGLPIYAEGSGLQGGQGRFQLSPTSPGYDAGLRLANFNDDLTGQGPDIGAHEAGTPPLEFGVNAYSGKP